MLHEHSRGFGSAGSLPVEHSAGAQRAAMLQRERAKRKKKDEGLQGGMIRSVQVMGVSPKPYEQKSRAPRVFGDVIEHDFGDSPELKQRRGRNDRMRDSERNFDDRRPYNEHGPSGPRGRAADRIIRRDLDDDEERFDRHGGSDAHRGRRGYDERSDSRGYDEPYDYEHERDRNRGRDRGYDDHRDYHRDYDGCRDYERDRHDEYDDDRNYDPRGHRRDCRSPVQGHRAYGGHRECDDRPRLGSPLSRYADEERDERGHEHRCQAPPPRGRAPPPRGAPPPNNAGRAAAARRAAARRRAGASRRLHDNRDEDQRYERHDRQCARRAPPRRHEQENEQEYQHGDDHDDYGCSEDICDERRPLGATTGRNTRMRSPVKTHASARSVPAESRNNAHPEVEAEIESEQKTAEYVKESKQVEEVDGDDDGAAVGIADPGYEAQEDEEEVEDESKAPMDNTKLLKALSALKPSSDAMRTFLTTPVPRDWGTVQCVLRRTVSGRAQSYQVFLDTKQPAGKLEQQRFLMYAKKMPDNKTANYHITCEDGNPSKDCTMYLGKLRSNFLGTEFTIYDDGINPKHARNPFKARDKSVRKELGAVVYQQNVLGSKGPRNMRAGMPQLDADGGIPVFRETKHDNIVEKFKRDPGDEGLYELINKPPRWDERIGEHVLNFKGRVTCASVKNFQFVRKGDLEHVLLQFGKIGKHEFTMDFAHPFTPLQAFAMSLSSIDSKKACE